MPPPTAPPGRGYPRVLRLHIPVRLIRSDVNLGFGVANNLALNKAPGQYPVLLNTDAFFHSGSLRFDV